MVRDGRERDEVQQALLGEALEYAPIGVLVGDEAGRYLAANRAACELTGYARSELLGLQAADLSASPAEIDERLRAMAFGRLRSGKAILRRKDGTTCPFEYRISETRSGGLPFFMTLFWEQNGSPA